MGSTEVIFDDEIVGLQEQAGCVQVQFKHSGDRQFDLVIGADGLHSGVRSLAFGPQYQFEKRLGYGVAAFEVHGYRPRDEDVYLMYGQPERMVGRFTLHNDQTLFLFVFTADSNSLPATLDLQKAMLRERYSDGKWECPRILDELDRTPELYFDRVSLIKMEGWSRGRIALVGDAAFCVSLVAGKVRRSQWFPPTYWQVSLPMLAGDTKRPLTNTKRFCGPTSVRNSEVPSALLPSLHPGPNGACGSAIK